MGVSENSVPLNPMVLLIIIPIKWLFVWEYTLFSDKPICPGMCNQISDLSVQHLADALGARAVALEQFFVSLVQCPRWHGDDGGMGDP